MRRDQDAAMVKIEQLTLITKPDKVTKSCGHDITAASVGIARHEPVVSYSAFLLGHERVELALALYCKPHSSLRQCGIAPQISELSNIGQTGGIAESYLVRVGECYGYAVGSIR
jgi:hypothetical protein